MLFNIYTANLNKLEDNKTQIFQYADDFLLMVFDHDFYMALQTFKLTTTTMNAE